MKEFTLVRNHFNVKYAKNHFLIAVIGRGMKELIVRKNHSNVINVKAVLKINHT